MPIDDFEKKKEHDKAYGSAALEAQLAEAKAGWQALCAAEGEESERVLAARGALAEVLCAVRHYGEALEHWERVTQAYMGLYGEDDELTLEAAEYLALCLDRVGRNEEALDVCDQFGLDEEILDGRE